MTTLRDLALQALDSDAARDELGARLAGGHPAELADLIESLEPRYRHPVWQLVSGEQRAELLTELHDDVLGQLVDEVPEAELVGAMLLLQADELADLEPLVRASVWESVLAELDAADRDNLYTVRRYSDDSAGGLMDVDAICVRPDVSMAVARRYLQSLRRSLGGLPEHTDSLVIVDDDRRVLGVLGLASVVSEPAAALVRDLYRPLSGIAADTPKSEVVRWFEDNDVTSAPVVNANQVVVGRITVDDVLDTLREEAEQLILHPAGLDEDVDLYAPLWRTFRRRAGWLALNLVIVFAAAWVIGRFEYAIAQLVALAVLMPVVASMGGVAGQQTLALVTRALAMRQIERGSGRRLLRREALAGAVIGAVFAVAVTVIGWFWFGNLSLGVVVGVALIVNVLIGVLMGALYPLFFDRVGIDPALAGGVSLTATTDIAGFFVFLALAALVLL